MTAPTNADVLAAFQSLGGQVVRPLALRFALQHSGFDLEAATDAINKALTDGVLGQSVPGGGLFRRRDGRWVIMN